MARQNSLILRRDLVKIKIIELAAQEFEDAIDWYDMQSSGLGSHFKKEVLKQDLNNEIFIINLSM